MSTENKIEFSKSLKLIAFRQTTYNPNPVVTILDFRPQITLRILTSYIYNVSLEEDLLLSCEQEDVAADGDGSPSCCKLSLSTDAAFVNISE